MLLHQILVTGLFERTKGPDNDLPQVQGRISLRSTPPSFPVLPPGTIQRRGEIVQNKLQPLKIYATWAPARIHPGCWGPNPHVREAAVTLARFCGRNVATGL